MERKTVWSAEKMERVIEMDEGLFRCLAAIYRLQTREEMDSHSTKKTNGVGFNKFDAPFLSELAEKLLRGQKLTANEMFKARLKMKKYTGQLVKLANGEIALPVMRVTLPPRRAW